MLVKLLSNFFFSLKSVADKKENMYIKQFYNYFELFSLTIVDEDFKVTDHKMENILLNKKY